MFKNPFLVLQTSLVFEFDSFDLFNDNQMLFFRLNQLSFCLFQLLLSLSQFIAFLFTLVFEVFTLFFQICVIIFDDLKLLLKQLLIDVQLLLKFFHLSFTVFVFGPFYVLLGQSRVENILLLEGIFFKFDLVVFLLNLGNFPLLFFNPWIIVILKLLDLIIMGFLEFFNINFTLLSKLLKKLFILGFSHFYRSLFILHCIQFLLNLCNSIIQLLYGSLLVLDLFVKFIPLSIDNIEIFLQFN